MTQRTETVNRDDAATTRDHELEAAPTSGTSAGGTNGTNAGGTSAGGTDSKNSGRRIAARFAPAIARRLRMVAMRARFRRAHFGARCDIRRGLHLSMAHGARVWFGRECVLDRDMTIECFGRLRVGNGVIFGHHCTLAARESVEIGDDCLIAEMVSIRDHDHCFDRLDIPTSAQGMLSSPVVIGRNVWLGAKVTITRGICIGDNAIVGANSVVTRDVPANAIAVGSPARVIKMRDDKSVDDKSVDEKASGESKSGAKS